MALTLLDGQKRLAMDKASSKRLPTGGFFSPRNSKTAKTPELSLERQSFGETLSQIALYAASKPSANKANCLVHYAQTGNPEQDPLYIQLINDLKQADIQVQQSNAASPIKRSSDSTVLTVTQSGVIVLEARLEKPNEKPKPYFFPRGKSYYDEAIRLVRELHGLDQREKELQKITSLFQDRRLGM